MSDIGVAENSESPSDSGIVAKYLVKTKPSQVLPTERISFEKQLSILRAYAAASGGQRVPVSNNEVAKYSGGIAESSISICNPFLCDIGLITREGQKQRPSQEVVDYLHAFQWEPATAAIKLRPIIESTWFATALNQMLSLRQLSKEDAIKFLAEECKASIDYRRNLETLLDFLGATGVVRYEGNAISKATIQPPPPDTAVTTPPVDLVQQAVENEKSVLPTIDSEVDQFSIPIPGKAPATICIPKGLDDEDWEMLSQMIESYVNRLRKANGKLVKTKPDGVGSIIGLP